MAMDTREHRPGDEDRGAGHRPRWDLHPPRGARTAWTTSPSRFARPCPPEEARARHGGRLSQADPPRPRRWRPDDGSNLWRASQRLQRSALLTSHPARSVPVCHAGNSGPDCLGTVAPSGQRVAASKRASPRSAPARSAPVRLAPERSARVRRAPRRSADCRSAFRSTEKERSAPRRSQLVSTVDVKSASKKQHPRAEALARVARCRAEPPRSASTSTAPVASACRRSPNRSTLREKSVPRSLAAVRFLFGRYRSRRTRPSSSTPTSFSVMVICWTRLSCRPRSSAARASDDSMKTKTPPTTPPDTSACPRFDQGAALSLKATRMTPTPTSVATSVAARKVSLDTGTPWHICAQRPLIRTVVGPGGSSIEGHASSGPSATKVRKVARLASTQPGSLVTQLATRTCKRPVPVSWKESLTCGFSVGVTGFEPATSSSRIDRAASRLAVDVSSHRL